MAIDNREKRFQGIEKNLGKCRAFLQRGITEDKIQGRSVINNNIIIIVIADIYLKQK